MHGTALYSLPALADRALRAALSGAERYGDVPTWAQIREMAAWQLPNEVERSASLPGHGVWLRRDSRSGTLYLSPRGEAELDDLWRRVFGRAALGTPGQFVLASDVRTLADRIAGAPSPDPDAARFEALLLTALRGSPDGMPLVNHRYGPERAAEARREEHRHLQQARMDAEDPAHALSAARAAQLVRGVMPMALMADYAPITASLRAGGASPDEIQRLIAAEIGARLLERRYKPLDLDWSEGQKWREAYLNGVKAEWGAGGIARGRSGNSAGVDLGALAKGGGGNGPGGAGGGYASTGGAAEAERGPFAADAKRLGVLAPDDLIAARTPGATAARAQTTPKTMGAALAQLRAAKRPILSYRPEGPWLGPKPNEIEANPIDGAYFAATPEGRSGVLYVSPQVWPAFASAVKTALGDDAAGSGAVYLDAANAARLRARIPDGTPLARILDQSPDGLVAVQHGQKYTPVARQEDVTHLWQARADGGDPGSATDIGAARAIVAGAMQPGSLAARLYTPVAEDALRRGYSPEGVTRMLAAEVGARLLTGRFSELGLSQTDGERWRQYYLDKIRERWGDEGIQRADSGNAAGVRLSDVADRNGKPQSQRPTLSHRKTGEGTSGISFGAATAGRAAGAVPAEAAGASAERGPFAELFHAWDKLSEPVAKLGNKAYGVISKYHGVSDEAEQALRAWGGRQRANT